MPGTYAAAVLDPFSPDARGAQVPDQFSYPTATQSIKTAFTVVSDANGSFDFALLPSLLTSVFTNNASCVLQGPFQAAYSVVTTTTGRTRNATTGGTTYPPSGFTGTNGEIYGVFTPDSLAAVYSQYRIVGCGARLRSQLIPQTSTGTLYACSLPAPARINGALVDYASQQTAADVDRTQFCKYYAHMPDIAVETAGTVANIYFNPVFQSFPTGVVKEHFELNQSGMEVSLKPISPAAYDWRDGSNEQLIGTGTSVSINEFGDTGFNNTGLQYGSDKSMATNFWSTEGWDAKYFRGSGFPASSKIFTVELVYHIEYIDATVALYSTGVWPPVNKLALDEVADAAAKMPMYRSLRDVHAEANMTARLGF